MTQVLERLAATIAARRGGDPASSHTAALLAKGVEKVAQKFGEEAVEAVIAAAAGDRDGLRDEAADTLYHLLVLLAATEVSLADVLATLEGREARSGKAEKAARVKIRRATDPADLDLCLGIRAVVFVHEQGVPAELEADGLDGECLHWMATQGGKPVGTARLRPMPEGYGKVQRVAVLRAARGHGIGAALMRAVLGHMGTEGPAEAVLDAQTDALDFYTRLGFAAEGPVFMDAGLPHQRMRLAVASAPSA